VPKANPLGLNETETIQTITPSANGLGEEVQLVRTIQYRAGTNTLGIVFFCLVFGTLLETIGEKGQVVINFFTAVFTGE
jgi:Na+/H+-dicarboxylate symporter